MLSNLFYFSPLHEQPPPPGRAARAAPLRLPFFAVCHPPPATRDILYPLAPKTRHARSDTSVRHFPISESTKRRIRVPSQPATLCLRLLVETQYLRCCLQHEQLDWDWLRSISVLAGCFAHRQIRCSHHLPAVRESRLLLSVVFPGFGNVTRGRISQVLK